MSQYLPPLRDMQFVIENVLDAPARWSSCAAFRSVDVGVVRQVLEQAGRFASVVLAPTNAPGDREGCRLVDGEVRTPSGFSDAYRAFVDGGWPSLACDPAYGGQGLPKLLNAAVYEMLLSANHAWAMYPGLLHGAYETIKRHGSEALRDRYLARIVSGEWLCAMALTEAQAGSDLGAVRTRAEPDKDGSLRVTGAKIFISGGDHDMTDNIVHLTLCRLPDAPPGSKGLSLALIPKRLPGGEPNAIVCDAIEEKMGIHGSATCSVRYEGATGWLVGEPHRGLAAMFVMMNSARLHVALQGLGHLEAVTQLALRYAHERVQMRVANRSDSAPRASADPIAGHPAMRRTLWSLKARTEGLRVLAFWTALQLDDAESQDEPATRLRASRRAAFMTPLVKYLLTFHGFQGSSDALQVLGGYGYLHEYGVEQHLRDARIAMIYEGTNEIQAIDLLNRRVLDDGGVTLDELIADLRADARRLDGDLHPYAQALEGECAAAQATTAALLDGREQDPEWPLRAADDYLMGVGYLMLAWAWSSMARAARDCADRELASEKTRLAQFGIEWLLPESAAHWKRAADRTLALPRL